MDYKKALKHVIGLIHLHKKAYEELSNQFDILGEKEVSTMYRERAIALKDLMNQIDKVYELYKNKEGD